MDCRSVTFLADQHYYDQTFGWIDKVVLTHLGLDADYETLMAICPDGTEPGIDGLTFTLK